jgi:pimeloyl-ACP methyl ester carboxylesterase
MNRRNFIEAVGGMLVVSELAGTASLAGSGRTETATFIAARRFVDTSFGRIACVDRGRGNAALFLHGFPLNSFQWRGAIERLAAHRRCIAPDFLGLGFTQVAPGGSVTPLDQVGMLVELLDTLTSPQVDVVASDSGGAVAQLLVARHPQRVRTLLLTNCDTEIDSPPPALVPVIDLARKGRFVDEWLAPWHANKTLARSPEGIGGMCYADPAHPTNEAIDYYFAPLLASNAQKQLVHAYASALDPNPLAGIAAALKRSEVPTRILWGTADTIFSAASPDYLDKLFGASRGVRRIEGAKLFWPEEQPDLIADEAKRLWSVR